MVEANVIDTNVLIVASAADDGSPFHPDATPVEEKSLRAEVLRWTQEFAQDAQRCVVLDWDWLICSEYQNKLTEQDYGWLAIMSKKDRNQVVWVGLQVDTHGHAILPTGLRDAVTDLEDRKMVAAVLAAKDNGHTCRLVNACDTDWLDCSQDLQDEGVHVHQLLEHWVQARHRRKKQGYE